MGSISFEILVCSCLLFNWKWFSETSWNERNRFIFCSFWVLQKNVFMDKAHFFSSFFFFLFFPYSSCWCSLAFIVYSTGGEVFFTPTKYMNYQVTKNTIHNSLEYIVNLLVLLQKSKYKLALSLNIVIVISLNMCPPYKLATYIRLPELCLLVHVGLSKSNAPMHLLKYWLFRVSGFCKRECSGN